MDRVAILNSLLKSRLRTQVLRFVQYGPFVERKNRIPMRFGGIVPQRDAFATRSRLRRIQVGQETREGAHLFVAMDGKRATDGHPGEDPANPRKVSERFR